LVATPEATMRGVGRRTAVITCALVVTLLLGGFLSAPAAGGLGTGKIVRYPVPSPQPLSFGGGAAWVSGSDGRWPQLWRVDATTGESVALPNTRGGLWPAFGQGFAWVTCSGARDNPCGDAAVLKLDPTTGATRSRIPLPTGAVQITTGLGAAWITTTGGLFRIDPQTDAITPIFVRRMPPENLSPNLVGVAAGRVWITSGGDVVGIAPSTGDVVARVHVGSLCSLSAGDAGVFAASCGSFPGAGHHLLTRIDPTTGTVVYSAALPPAATGFMTQFDGQVWIAGLSDKGPAVIPLDPSTGAVKGAAIPVPSGTRPYVDMSLIAPMFFIAGGAGSLWLTHVDANDVVRVGIV
jgi:outer membrane protein assembly factor BamB